MDAVRTPSILARGSTPATRQWFEDSGIAVAEGPLRTPGDPAAGGLTSLVLLVRHAGRTHGGTLPYAAPACRDGQRPHRAAGFCPDPDEVEARSLVAFCVAIGEHFLVADHGDRTRGQVLARAADLLLDRPPQSTAAPSEDRPGRRWATPVEDVVTGPTHRPPRAPECGESPSLGTGWLREERRCLDTRGAPTSSRNCVRPRPTSTSRWSRPSA